jgi:hypothetical protein
VAASAAAPLHRSLVWILVDTLRADTFTGVVARSPELRGALDDFAWYQSFRTCVATTRGFLRQTLAPLLGPLRTGGYDMAHFGYYDAGPRVAGGFVREAEADALARAAAWIERRPEGAPAFAFVHLRGGHAPWPDGVGTPSDRYRRQVEASAPALAAFLARVPPSWVVALGGDHGEAFGEHGNRYHSNSLYDELLRTPLYMRGPSISPGAVGVPIGCADLNRKLLRALAGLPDDGPVARYQLASLNLKFFRDHGSDWDVRLRALVIAPHKAIWNVDLETWELYDLGADPGERRDLALIRPDLLAQFRLAMRQATATGLIDEHE